MSMAAHGFGGVKPLYLMIAYVLLMPMVGHAMQEETLKFGGFGTVTLYHVKPAPSHVVLFVSGDGGWNKGVVDMARELASLDALVAGIDITHYLASIQGNGGQCSYPAADFELLSKYIQKKLGYPSYVSPVLVGYSSGATLVYAALVQAPPGTFKGTLSLGFCPDLEVKKPFCKGYGLEWETLPKGKGYNFLPAKNLQVPWVALQGSIDLVCDPPATEAFVKEVRNGEIIMLPKVGHGFSVPRNWMPQFKDAFARMASPRNVPVKSTHDSLGDLPLVEVPARTPAGKVMAIMISGDGGWAGLDRDIAGALSEKGIPVIGLDSLRYFWTKRSVQGASTDLARIMRHFLSAWNKESVLLVGYSQGADVLPFMAGGLPGDLAPRVRLTALIGPGLNADFEFHVTNWINGSSGSDAVPLLPEFQKLKGMKVLCISSSTEQNESICPRIGGQDVRRIILPGGHHFGGDYRNIAEIILQEAGS